MSFSTSAPMHVIVHDRVADVLTRALVLSLGLVVVLLGSAPQSLQAQDTTQAWSHSATVFTAGSTTGTLPFWLYANQYGTVDPQSANAGVRVQTQRSFVKENGFDYAVGAALVGRAAGAPTLHLHELYGRVRYNRLQLTVGRREQMMGRVDTSLSLGSTTWSRNASPLSKVSVSSEGYLAVPGTRNALAVSGYFAHGWLEHDRFVQDALLHEKSLYLRLLPPDFLVTAHAGITHHAMWGGTHPQRGDRPSGIDDWAYVVVGASKESEGGGRETGVNQLASYDFSLDATIAGVKTRLYRQFYHEDLPSLWFRNPWDGLWGLRLRRDDPSALVSGILWEHLRMTRHNAKFSEGEERGEDNYYHHSVYRGGWTYQGRTLGIPLLTTPSTTPGLNDQLPGIGNSIVVAHHLGVEGQLRPGWTYRLLGTYSRNYGAQGVCETPECRDRVDRRTSRTDQYSVRVELRAPLLKEHNLWLRTALAFDTGAFYEDRIGGTVRLTWRGP